ncbi:MAG: hypothetical protein NW214_04520 [Pseudanabaenaceae cyanobacterium bins.39]|nr:hypothetical protein [Pseudanabaenaceae cyanobacterium bins.39]
MMIERRLGDRVWANAKMVTPITKQTLPIRLDSNILNWLKNLGKSDR